MIIKKAEFVISAVSSRQYPEANQPEIVLAGRSNVGKSSLINKMLNRKNLARTSSQPGKTQTLNFYRINDSWFFVDLPGYGYARVAKDINNKWAGFINEYLETRQEIVGLIQLVDLRHPPTEDDRNMVQWSLHHGFPMLVAATKADKISRAQWPKHKAAVMRGLEIGPEIPLILFSAETGMGVPEVGTWIEERLGAFPIE